MPGSDRRLHWVQRNRTKRRRDVGIGEPVRRLVDRCVIEGEIEAKRVVEILAPVMDSEFRRHCRVAVDNRGGLIISVDQAGLVFAMRTSNLMLIRDTLDQAGRPVREDRIRFEYGTAGTVVP